MSLSESPNLEFKQSENDAFLKTVCAFANFGGGKIIFGVDDGGNAIGLKDTKKTKLSIENKINDTITPKPHYSFVVNEEKKTITLIVEDGKDKPYFYNGQIFKRNDTSTVALDINEQKRIILEYSDKSYDQLKISKTDLTFNYLKEKLESALGIETFNQDTLRTLELKDNDGYNNAALLLADKNDYKVVDMVRFGKDINIFLERVTIENESVLKSYYDAVDVFKRYYTYEEVKGFKRDTIEKIPELAFREAIVNALVHRDWGVNAFIRIEMYDDKIIIASPGGLPAGISEIDYLDGNVSILKNPIIGNIFFRLKLIEKFGTGIRKIKLLYDNCPNKPEFKVTENSISIVLPTVEMNTSISIEEKDFLELMQDKVEYSIDDLVKLSKMTKSKIIRTINKLIDKHKIERKGLSRATKYIKM